jgi:sugar transferase (PEP-CTERM system associated)
MLRFLNRRALRSLLLLGIVEWLLLAITLYLAMRVRFTDDPASLAESFRHPQTQAILFGTVLTLGMAALGMYQPHTRETLAGRVARLAVGMGLGALGLTVLYYILPQVHVGRGIFVIALGLGFLGVLALRSLFQKLLDGDALKRRVLVLGAGESAALIPQLLRRRSDRRGFLLVGYVPVANETCAVPREVLVELQEDLHDYATRKEIDEILVAVEDRRGRLPMEALFRCRQRGVAVTDIASFFESESGQVPLALTDPSWLVFSGGFLASPARRASKRALDLVAACVVLLLSWPLMLLVMLAIRIESGRGQPILYWQERVGQHGAVFRLVKFRSMRTDAECDGRARWAGKNDSRVTRVGRFIRKARLDELPQLWNVLRGEMSFIGPRPERPDFVRMLAQKIRYYDARHCVKPGLTGWAQLLYPYGASEHDAAQKLKYDLFYIKNQNMVLDLLILLQTVEVVLFGRGAR